MMQTEYWLKRWQEGRTGWHHEQPMPLLVQHWPALALPRGARVLVPLCGKSVDMLWLSGQGFEVLGVELSPIAVESFLAENALHARTRPSEMGTVYEVANPPGAAIQIINGDVFDVDAATLASCHAFYDRAALIALPEDVRAQLVSRVYARLPARARGLLITLDYPPHEMEGPPFPVDDAEVGRLFNADWRIERLESRDILHSQPSFQEKGVTALGTAIYALERRG